MGNNASKQGEKDRDREKDALPSSPVVNHTLSSSTSNSRREPRSGSIRRKHPDDASAASSLKSQTVSQAASLNTTTSQEVPKEEKMGVEQSKTQREEKPNIKATPVRVPRGSDPHRQRGPDSQFEPSGPPRDLNYIPHSNLNPPPRLPLPIEEEVHAPGSPVIQAQNDAAAAAFHQESIDSALPRQSSAISSTTVEDDDVGNDAFQTQHEPVHGYVPTQITWKQGGEKVYVTGTFANWGTKVRMQKDPKTGHYSAVLQLRPGTHHVKFIIDGDMQLSNDLPTAADFTNILVNYIEVSADDVPKEQALLKPPEDIVPEGITPPQVLPTGTEAKDHAPDSVGKTQPQDPQTKAEPVFWGKELPPYLADVEKPEHSNKYQRSARVVADFATPPGLPMFLGKSILNGATPMKDDASVLNMPNHTVLNHLATSSIKNEVLATSITTRYIRKMFQTEISAKMQKLLHEHVADLRRHSPTMDT